MCNTKKKGKGGGGWDGEGSKIYIKPLSTKP